MAGPGIYPLMPFAIPKPWGGGHLDALAQHAGENHIGEYVIFSDLWQFPVRVRANGEEILLSEFWKRQGLAPGELPFMLKILSTAEPISLQNHPSDDDVKTLGLEGNGKFECWSILEADEYARAYLGLKEGEDVSVLKNIATDTNPLSHFNEYFPRSGDIIKLEPGLIHSTTGRLLFYEIQQKSDHTFRLYDFGRGRALHIKEAMACVRQQKPDISLFSAGLKTDKFSVTYHNLQDNLKISRQGNTFSVLTWFGTAAEITCRGETFQLGWGDSVLVLTSAKFEVQKRRGNPPESSPLARLPMIDMLFEAYV